MTFSVSIEPLMQIIGGVGLVLNGVLTLLGNILNGIGLGGILNGILDALGLNKLLGRSVYPPPLTLLSAPHQNIQLTH